MIALTVLGAGYLAASTAMATHARVVAERNSLVEVLASEQAYRVHIVQQQERTYDRLAAAYQEQDGRNACLQTALVRVRSQPNTGACAASPAIRDALEAIR
jgi:hypothetical protein